MQNFTELNDFPFRSVLNLRLLLEFWERKLQTRKDTWLPNKALLEQLSQVPELRASIEDDSVLEKHKDLIDVLIGAVIPSASVETEISAAIVPFVHKPFYSTQPFKRAIPHQEQLEKLVSVNIPGNKLAVGMTIQACHLILKKYYLANLNLDKPILITVHDPQSNLDKVYKVVVDHRFCEIVNKGPLKPIDPHVIKFLTEKIYDLDLWLQYIRPEDFEFHGFTVLRMTDVTEEEMLSSIKYDLLKKDAVVDHNSFQTIQQKLRSIFAMPDLMLGLAYFDPNNNLILNSGSESYWKSLADTDPENCSFTGSVYERSWMEKRYVTIEDLETFPFRTGIEDSLLANNIRSILLAPLVDEDQTIGLLELASPSANKLNPISASKVENVLPMFTVAVKRVKSDMETEVRALIQEECTAIHPTVQWRFFEAGLRLLNKRRALENAALEEIVFHSVYPFFGMIDIRNSSQERNAAIQFDLHENLKMASALLESLFQEMKLPLLEEMIYKAQNHLSILHHSLASGDEISILEFLRSEVNPLLDHFASYSSLRESIDAYKAKLDTVNGVVYKRRKAFEESLTQINELVGDIIDKEEETAQQMFPHYFEKYKTDGVEFTLYLGESLVQNKKFDSFYLKNFRLWQLSLMCTIANRMDDLKPRLINKLDVTQLILVHDQPVTIRFRSDEKQFDVDGAYDIRYEIVKKRIDKAHINHTKERLTQPGKIAIVYSQTKIADEYRQYFGYLQNKGLIKDEIEELELEELPGATGLKALRITVAKEKHSRLDISPGEFIRGIEKALSA